MRFVRGCSMGWLLLLGVALAPVAAQEKEEASRLPTSALTGRLVRLDLQAGTLTLQRQRAGEATVYTTPDTQILIADEPGKLADLKEGERVQVSVRADAQKRWTARWIRDERTMALYEEEGNGISATILAVNAQERQIVVRTQAGKERMLQVQLEGRLASRLMKDGRPATLDAFRPQEHVWVSLRRTSGKTLYLKGLADELTFLSFLIHPTHRGSVAAISPPERRLQFTPEQGDPLPVRWTNRTQVFLQGKTVDPDSLTEGLYLYVVESGRSRGVVTARAFFDEQSWRAYAQALQASLQQKQAGLPSVQHPGG